MHGDLLVRSGIDRQEGAVPYFRVRATNGRAEIVIEESFADEAELRAVLPRRGWTTVLSVEPIAAPTAATAADGTPPPPIRADQIREDGEWVSLPQELAEQHPLHGIGGWLGLLLALMILGAALSLVPMFQLASYLSDGGGLIWTIFLVVLAVQIVNVAAIVLLMQRSPAFPPTFIALTVIGLVSTLILFALGGLGIGNIIGMIMQIVWLCYVLMSRRVNVTFRRRVQREDEWLKQGLAAGEAPVMAAS